MNSSDSRSLGRERTSIPGRVLLESVTHATIGGEGDFIHAMNVVLGAAGAHRGLQWRRDGWGVWKLYRDETWLGTVRHRSDGRVLRFETELPVNGPTE